MMIPQDPNKQPIQGTVVPPPVLPTETLKCQNTKIALNYYLQKKIYDDDRCPSLRPVFAHRHFNEPWFLNLPNNRKTIINNLLISFKNQKKERQKNSFVTRMHFLKSGREVIIGYNRTDRGDINFIDLTKPKVADFYYKELKDGLGGIAPYQDSRRVLIADRKGKFTWIDVLKKELNQINKKAVQTDIDGILDISLSPSQTKLACGTKDKSIVVMDLMVTRTAREIKPESSTPGEHEEVRFVNWHQYMSILVSSSADETVKLWDIRTPEAIYTHREAVGRCMFAPDGYSYFCVGKDKQVAEYDIRKKQNLVRYQMEDDCKDFAIVGNSTSGTLVCGEVGGTLRWFTRGGEPIWSAKGESGVLALAVDQTCNWMMVARKDGNMFEMYEAGDTFI